MKTYGYVRSSRPPKESRRLPAGEAREHPLGIESQRRDILTRFPDAIIHEDRFRSGRTARRPGLRSMLDAVEPGDMVVVVRLDRLARDSRLALAIELEIETTRGARLVSLAGEGTSVDGPPDATAVFVRRVLAAQAELTAAQTSAATRAAFRVKRERGISPNGNAHYGYRVGDGGRLVEDDGEQTVLRAIVERTRGRLFNASAQELADWLNRSGFRNRRGNPFDRSTVRLLVRRLRDRQEQGLDAVPGTRRERVST